MQNWEDIHECEDEHDKERLRKRASITVESLAMTNTVNQTFSDVETDDIDISFNPTKIARKDILVLQTIHVLEQSQWLTSSNSCKEIMTIHSKTHSIPTPSTQQLKEWMNSVKEQEIIIARSRQTGDMLEHFPPNTGINNI